MEACRTMIARLKERTVKMPQASVQTVQDGPHTAEIQSLSSYDPMFLELSPTPVRARLPDPPGNIMQLN